MQFVQSVSASLKFALARHSPTSARPCLCSPVPMVLWSKSERKQLCDGNTGLDERHLVGPLHGAALCCTLLRIVHMIAFARSDSVLPCAQSMLLMSRLPNPPRRGVATLRRACHMLRSNTTPQRPQQRVPSTNCFGNHKRD